MSYTIGINYVVVGNRDMSNLHKSIELIRKYRPDIPITICHDLEEHNFSLDNVTFKKFERIRYPQREENRNSSLWRLISLKESEYDVTLYLDNDIYIVHEGFFEGFDIAYHYGISMVQNPRMFIKTYEGNIGDLDKGMDVLPFDKNFCKDMPNYMNSYNMGVTFHNKHDEKSEVFLDNLIWEQQNNPSRGQAGLYRTIWKTKMFPYCLPVNWLVCKEHNGIEHPLSLHVGHKEIYEWWKEEYDR